MSSCKVEPYEGITVEGTVHALRHLPWLGVDKWLFHKHAAFWLPEPYTMESAERLLYYFAIMQGSACIDASVLWAFFKEITDNAYQHKSRAIA